MTHEEYVDVEFSYTGNINQLENDPEALLELAAIYDELTDLEKAGYVDSIISGNKIQLNEEEAYPVPVSFEISKEILTGDPVNIEELDGSYPTFLTAMHNWELDYQLDLAGGDQETFVYGDGMIIGTRSEELIENLENSEEAVREN